MSIALEAIRFNCQPGLPGITALNIRKNGQSVVPLPEWQAGYSVNSRQSLAAYATAGSWGLPVHIQARFRRVLAGPSAIEVRALPISPLRDAWQWLEPLAPAPAAVAALRRQISIGDHVLGEVRARWIELPAAGETGDETFELPFHRLWSTGVGIHPIGWRWQCREASGLPWRDFAMTRHRVYTVLGVPQSPWQQFPFTPDNTQLPWTDVLDYACLWASGSQTPDAAATAVTSAVYSLGPAVLQYGCPIFALTQYSLLYFDCTAFLERLAGGYGNGPYVNCSDCATFVSTFANSLGCDLWQSRMGPAVGIQFDTNPILAIGTFGWSTPCVTFTGFQYHEVAWKGACSFPDRLFDACLLVNGNFSPPFPPFLPLLPANLPFTGLPGLEYRARLAAPASQLNCVPQPLSRQRRFVI